VSENVVVLTGGVGGAKLVLGLTQVVAPDRITAIVNTGDDFRHVGLWICPDLDTLLYTLAGKA
jgi:LPPG:FO 2-phospho-L-lactate transferase